MDENYKQDSFSFHKKTDGTLIFNVNGGINAKQATKELVIASINLAIQQGYVDPEIKTIEGLLFGLLSEEDKKIFNSPMKESNQIKKERTDFDSAPKMSGSISRKRITLDRRKKI